MIYIICSFPCKCQSEPCPNAQKHHQQRLNRVDNQHEIERIGLAHAVENQHRFHGEMPRSGTIRRGYDDGETADDERSHRTADTQRLHRVETEKCQVVMQEITAPNRHRIEHEQRNIPHVSQRHDALPNARQRLPHLIIYRGLRRARPFLRHSRHENPRQNDDGREANRRDDPSRQRESVENCVETRASFLEKRRKHAELRGDRQQGDENDQQRVDGAFRDHRSQRFRKRNAVFLAQNAAAQKLSASGNQQRGRIRQKHGIDAHGSPRLLAQRLQRLPPPPSSENLRHDAERKRQQHPRPRHLAREYIANALEVEIAIHPVENRPAQHKRNNHVQRIFPDFFHFSKYFSVFWSQSYEKQVKCERKTRFSFHFRVQSSSMQSKFEKCRARLIVKQT